MRIDIVNCFSTKKKNSGNPAAIVRDFIGGRNEKQQLAKDLGLPVTVFLSEKNHNYYHVEFFYPETEMPLCLHGAIGAGFILLKDEKINKLTLISKNENELQIRREDETIQVCVSQQSIPVAIFNKNLLTQMLNIQSIDEIDHQLPLAVSSIGSPKLLIPLVSFESLSSLKPNTDLIASWSIENNINGLYVYTKDSKDDDFDFYARGFNPRTGHYEDAATGVAAAALALSLKRNIIVGQGQFIQRPSEINVSYDNPDTIWVGGKVQEQINDINDIDINFKEMNEDDLYLLHQWFQIPHVLKWYAKDKKYTLEMIREKYLPRISDASIPSFIIYDNDKPVGYIQFYHVTDHLPEGIINYNHPLFNDFKPKEIAGIDLFIADENYLHTGFSSKALEKFISMYINNKFKAILVDPVELNTSAISFFRRNGFENMMSQDNNHYLMILRIT
jgi:PhzF family phenazine biosynthesis protein